MVNTFSGASNRRPKSDVSTWAPVIVFGHTEIVTVRGRSVTCGEHEQSRQIKQEAQAAANNLEIGFAVLAASVETDSPSSLAEGPIGVERQFLRGFKKQRAGLVSSDTDHDSRRTLK
jgi:hypothetical protein